MSEDSPILRAGNLEVGLAPAVGGAIAWFDRLAPEGRQPLLRHAPVGTGEVLDMACFPLVPFANRIRGGTFQCDDRTVRLAPNMAGDPSPLHGQGWRGAWTVAECGPRNAVLAFTHAAGEWPWDYEVLQRIDLDPEGLSLTLTCVNRSEARMPCGLGFHPYYPCDAATILDAAVERAWTVDAAVLPVESVPATGRYDLRERRICGQGLDNGFDGWRGTASITWAGAPVGLRLFSPDAPRLQVYSPRAGGLFVAEPVQNANAALNAPQDQWPDLGIVLLEEGRRASLHARFDIVRA